MPESNEFLSGEVDSNLGSMLESLHLHSKESNAKIRIIESSSSSDDNDDDDEAPPRLDAAPISSTNQSNDVTTSNDQTESLLEQMMKEAMKAKKQNDEKKEASIRKNAKKSFGLKKGFLNASSSKPKKNRAKRSLVKAATIQPMSSCDDTVYELDQEGNMIMIPAIIETIPKPDASAVKRNPLHIDEVQESMKESSSWDAFAQSNWSSPDLLQRISSDPILIKGMSNPKYIAALEALQKDPKEAMSKFQNHDDVKEFLNRMCHVFGDHFTQLGEQQDKEKQDKQSASIDLKEEDIGPVAYSILQKEKTRKEQGLSQSSEENMSREEKEQVDFVMKDEELTRILMDVDMQLVMQECSSMPGKMQMYMRHEVYGRKLQKLIHAGLLRVA